MHEKIYTHDYGLCSLFTKETKDYFKVVWVPKNASSFLRKTQLRQSRFDKDEFCQNYIVFLRNPYFRWKTGIVEYIMRKKNFEKVADNLDRIEFDEHTVPQYKFLPKNGTLRFYNLDNGLQSFIDEFQINTSYQWFNTFLQDQRKIEIMKNLDRCLTPQLIDRVIDYYANDYLFLKKVGSIDVYHNQN